MGFLSALFPNIELGIKISNQVMQTLFKDKGLFIYPVVMVLLSFVLLIAIFVPFVFLGGFSAGPLSMVAALILYYLVTTFMATYFLFALYIAFTSFVQGKKIGMGTALAQAGGYLPQIIGWTIFYTIVMTIVTLIESQVRNNRGALGMIFGFLLQSIISIGLFLGTTFAIPVMYEERVGPWEAVKKSAMFIINNIGKTFSGIIYFDIIAFVIKIVGMLFIGGAIFMGAVDLMINSGTTIPFLFHTSLLEIIAVFIFGIAIYIVGMLFNYVTLHIYYLVLYDYVKNSKVPKGMDETLIKSSIKHTTGATGLQGGKGSGKKGGGGGGGGGGGQQGGGIFGNLFQSGGGNSPPDMKDYVK